MIKLIESLVPDRIASIEAGNPVQDMVTWNILNSPRALRSSVKVQAHAQLVLSMAAIHTSSLTASHILYDLAARPDYIDHLRKELDSVVGRQVGRWLDKTSLPKLKLLDSFFKESQRLNPLSITGFNRKAMQDIVLHSGETIPKGAHIACASAEIMRDPEIYPNADTFDGYRYVNLRSDQKNLHHFVSASIDNMNWGYGPHACPGRFFANTQLKLIVAHVLRHYDLKMPEGKGRPGAIIMPSGLGPDISQPLLMKRRS